MSRKVTKLFVAGPVVTMACAFGIMLTYSTSRSAATGQTSDRTAPKSGAIAIAPTCQVRVFDAYVARSKEQAGEQDRLFVHLLVKNTGTTELRYVSWGDASNEGQKPHFTFDGAILSDVKGQRLAMVPRRTMLAPLRGGSHAIPPEHFIEEVLVFEKPVDGQTDLTLDLPARNVGSDGLLRLHVQVQ